MTLVTPVLTMPVILGESPVWCDAAQALYWVDIKWPSINRFNPVDGSNNVWQVDEFVGCVAPIKGGEARLQCATESGFKIFDTETGQFTAQTDPEAHLQGNRFNDGKFDPYGYFWAGTMDQKETDPEAGSFYRYDPRQGTVDEMDKGYHVTNGPAFDPVRERVYLNDSARKVTYVADYSGNKTIDNKRVFLSFRDGDGYPDGMSVADDGSVWIAFWDGYCIRQFSPEGDLLQQIDLPQQRPTSLAFCGKDIYVTIASLTPKSARKEEQAALLKVKYKFED